MSFINDKVIDTYITNKRGKYG